MACKAKIHMNKRNKQLTIAISKKKLRDKLQGIKKVPKFYDFDTGRFNF